MSTRLERYVFPALVALALWAAVLVAVPAAAQAQAAVEKDEDARGADRGAGAERHVVVVDPGDTLWSISSEVLRPNATPRQIAAGAERIYALNREQIGPDPNLIFAGQRLSVPLARGAAEAASDEAASDEAASGGDPAGRQAERGTVEAPSQAAAPEPAPLPDAAQAAPAPGARPPAAEGSPRPPGESYFGEARGAVAGVASAIAGLFPSAEGHEGHAWRELLGAALLAVSSVAFVLTLLLAFALAVAAPKRASRSRRGEWRREVHANSPAYELASFDPSPDEELVNGPTGAHANGSHANGSHANGEVPVGTIRAAERERGR